MEKKLLRNLKKIIKNNPHFKKDSRLFCCPTSGCTGFVEKDEEANVYGCSECGDEWKMVDKVYELIEKIIKKYPYRKKVYLKKGKIWKSIALGKIPKDYYDKVQEEDV